ncbi:hypothetical protein H4219_006462, partial [Mycoemilia scoparia]
MDDTVVFLKSIDYYPTVKIALDHYCLGTNAAFNLEKTELLLANHSPSLPEASLPAPPVPDGQAIRYLGSYLGNNIALNELADQFIESTLTHAKHTAAIASTLHGRASLLATYSVPRLSYISRLIPFTSAQIARLDQALRALLWDRSKPWLNQFTIGLPTGKGGLRFPPVATILAAGRIQFAYSFCEKLASFAQSLPGLPPIDSQPWPKLLVDCWHAASTSTDRPALTRSPSPHLTKVLINPFAQLLPQTRLPKKAWPAALQSAYEFVAKNQGNLSLDLPVPFLSPSNAEAPLIGHPAFPLTKQDWTNISTVIQSSITPVPPLTIWNCYKLATMLRTHFQTRSYGPKPQHEVLADRLVSFQIRYCTSYPSPRAPHYCTLLSLRYTG